MTSMRRQAIEIRMRHARAVYAREHSKIDEHGRRVWSAGRPSFRAWVRALAHDTVLGVGAVGKLRAIRQGATSC